ncbi:MAG: pantetheine-phosphate adenylyltransferase [Planctomycetes bacterium]|nr:pantetheine-phosphate adenylyltransferase [Planctomycetota bacterium]MCB9936526.1 pantetheine-phosphate adenylyltransferase [Planctomycetota bacterium]
MPHRLAVYPGTFDPVSNGHLDVIQRGSQLFEQLVVACAVNIAKEPLFSLDERIEMLRETTADLPNVRVESFTGMVVDYVRGLGGKVILRGLRTFSDYENEVQMAYANRTFAPDVETVFVCASLEESFISSRLIREAAALDGDISRFVPETVAKRLHQKAHALKGAVKKHGKGR